MTKTYKYVLTFALFFCYFAYGVNFYVVGPTLIELAGLFQTTIERISLIYTARSAGYTCGSLSGFAFKYVNRQLAFVFFLTLMGVTLAIIPHCTTMTQMLILASVNGFSIGTFDTAINVWILEIWEEKSGPFMQALHFTYGIGSFVAPLICEPFLSSESIHSGAHGVPMTSSSSSTSGESSALTVMAGVTSTPSSVAPTTMATLASAERLISSLNETAAGTLLNASEVDGMLVDSAVLHAIDPIDFLIYIPYAIAGTITVVSSAVVLFLYYYRPYQPPTKKKGAAGATTGPADGTVKCIENGDLTEFVKYQRKSPPCLTIWLVTMGSMFLTFFVGMEQMHLQFLPTFVVNTELEISPSTAAMMSSAAALAFTIGRGLSIPLAMVLRPQTILYSNHALMLLGTIILALYANSSVEMLWVGNAILGVGFSSVYASIYAFLEHQIRVTNRIGSVFVFAGGLTAALSPSLVGQYIEANPLILVWFNLVCCLLCLTILIIIHLTVYLCERKPVKKLPLDNGSGSDSYPKQNRLRTPTLKSGGIGGSFCENDLTEKQMHQLINGGGGLNDDAVMNTVSTTITSINGDFEDEEDDHHQQQQHHLEREVMMVKEGYPVQSS